jgi:hypothetical protein
LRYCTQALVKQSIILHQAPDFDDMSSFFWYVTDNVYRYTNSVQAPLDIEIRIYFIDNLVIFSHFGILGLFCVMRHLSPLDVLITKNIFTLSKEKYKTNFSPRLCGAEKIMQP